MQIHKIAAFLDELEKIGGRKQTAGYMQSRSGTRPYRVSTLLSRTVAPPFESSAAPSPEPSSEQQDMHAPEQEQSEAPPASQDEAGEEAAIGKVASEAKPKPFGERVMSGMSEARPYVVGGVKAAIPSAFFAKIMAGEGPKATHSARVAGLVGAGLGVGNEVMKRWAEKNKRKELAQKILNAEQK